MRSSAAVHHAEVVAHRVGEPFGSLVLAVAVTVIEVALIVTLMVSSDSDTSTLAHDTAFAAVMITCNGIVSMSLLVGTLRHRVAADVHHRRARGGVLAGAARVRGGRLARAVEAVVFVQTVRHRDYFLPARGEADDPDEHAAPPSDRETTVSLALLIVALVRGRRRHHPGRALIHRRDDHSRVAASRAGDRRYQPQPVLLPQLEHV